jgi:hypothetical protein
MIINVVQPLRMADIMLPGHADELSAACRIRHHAAAAASPRAPCPHAKLNFTPDITQNRQRTSLNEAGVRPDSHEIHPVGDGLRCKSRRAAMKAAPQTVRSAPATDIGDRGA